MDSFTQALHVGVLGGRMDFDRRAQRSATAHAVADDRAMTPGKRTLAEGAVQRTTHAAAPDSLRADRSAASAPTPLLAPASSPQPTLQMLFGVPAAGAAPAEGTAQIHGAAARGTATPASKLPYADRIQRAFGRHDISGIQA